MSREQQKSGQNLPAKVLAGNAQGLATALDSSVGQSSAAIAQLASEVQATIEGGQQSQRVNPSQPSLSMNTNAPVPPIIPIQNSFSLPMMWNGAPVSGPSYQIPQSAYWAPTQRVLTQSNTPATRKGTTSSTPAAVEPATNAYLSSQSIALPNISTSSVIQADSNEDAPVKKKPRGKSSKKASLVELSVEEKAMQSRVRNREHARSTRLRKKAYVHKLKEMADGLRAIQTEEIRQRRMAVHKMAEVQKIRRDHIQTVLKYQSNYEGDPKKWSALLEDSFWYKQPVTPFRSFRRVEVDKNCRILRGVDAMICDAASISCMVERIGCRNARWQQIKRKKFLETYQGQNSMIGPLHTAMNDNQQAESSLSSGSSTDSSCSSSGRRPAKRDHPILVPNGTSHMKNEVKKVSSSSESNNGNSETALGKTDYSGGSSTAAKVENYEGPRKRQKGSHLLSATKSPSHDIVQVRPQFKALSRPPNSGNAPTLIMNSADRLSSSDHELKAYYALNEDDMITIDDILMCPFVFRTKNAVQCGALADCVMPGMLRATFSKANKLYSLEVVFDAMGFMQQLDGANGGKVTAQVIPGSLEMALMHCAHEARVITMAKPPFCIVHVNEPWTRLTKYSQLEVEGRELLDLIEGGETDPNAGTRPGKPMHKLEEVSKGKCACSTNIHYDKFGNSFVDFMCSYPLTNAADEISHLLHVNLPLPKMNALI